MRKKAKRFVLLVTVIVLALTLQVTAETTITHSTEKTATVLNHTYTYSSTLCGDDNSVWAYTKILVDKGNVPAGYFGNKANLYNTNGVLVKTSGWVYNTKELAGQSISTGEYYTPGIYYSKGQVQIYNGNGYNTYTANASPNIALNSVNTIQFNTNDAGQTYGSDMFVSGDEGPDLVLALGTNGITGYVYANELYGNNESTSYHKVIPLYEEDGITVIDTFEIYGEQFEIKER